MTIQNNQNNVALITGASKGIGKELAHIHAAKGGDLVLVARNKQSLDLLKAELENQYKVSVTVIALDLSLADSAQQVFEQTEQLGIEVDVLINNAGFGGHGKFHERELSADQAMMQLNMVTLSNLTHLYLQGMVARNSGKILNVSSTASFLPGPLQAVYYATKAYVTSFSQAVAEEVAENNITITALCPGTVATGFVEAGNLEGVDAWKNAASAESVAECGYQAMEKGELVAINQRSLSFMLNWIIPFMPRKTLLKISRQAMEKTK
ncbi:MULTISPECIES: SDR family NAD(P)-dependent oxidoreductase [unclassified Agarivorans]|uniref:SDR family NAD(P)-dependent oxidoreductase n=1 Tax=unclassified Agarivorans TaxID=2636026 RepID=UPI0026E3E6F2|nr:MULTISPECIES: SDR family oxidoreductase [unclassified Agarivorans]MDO6684814.1 SDR family oxidoreductase [Agarivorans sp. 3_MG-2023]MDO6715025.1 SDR family oxidoreductase [Agarivorans sp. 2_MG-2023]